MLFFSCFSHFNCIIIIMQFHQLLRVTRMLCPNQFAMCPITMLSIPNLNETLTSVFLSHVPVRMTWQRVFVCMTFPLLQLIFLKHLHSWPISGLLTEGVNEYRTRLNELMCLLSEPCNPWEMSEGRRKLSGGNVLHRCHRCSANGTTDVLPDLGRSWTMPVCDVASFLSFSFRFLPLFPCGSQVMLPLLYHLFQGGAGVTGAKSSDSMGIGQGTPWTSRQLITGPLLMAVAAAKVPTAHQEQFGVQT